jgi:hypothetical protein
LISGSQFQRDERVDDSGGDTDLRIDPRLHLILSFVLDRMTSLWTIDPVGST